MYIDETYARSKWTYLSRAVDRQGRTVDFLLSQKRDQVATVRFLQQAIITWKQPTKVSLDRYGATHQAILELKKTQHLSCRERGRSPES